MLGFRWRVCVGARVVSWRAEGSSTSVSSASSSELDVESGDGLDTEFLVADGLGGAALSVFLGG